MKHTPITRAHLRFLKTSHSRFKRIVLSGSLGIMLLIAASCSQMSELVTDEQAGWNGGFEKVENGLPVNWMVYTQRTTGSGDFDVAFDTLNPKAGHRALAFNVRNCDDRGGRFSPGLAREIPAKEGETYEISFWVRNSGASYVTKITGINALDKADGLTQASSQQLTDWTFFSYQYTIPPAMNKLRFELNITGAGTFAIDEIAMEKK